MMKSRLQRVTEEYFEYAKSSRDFGIHRVLSFVQFKKYYAATIDRQPKPTQQTF